MNQDFDSEPLLRRDYAICYKCGAEPRDYASCKHPQCLQRKVETVMSANDRQVGGNHYASEFQHWDICEDNGVGYLESAATKYLVRWRSKNGIPDLEKSMHYTEKLHELSKLDPKDGRPRRFPRGSVPCTEIMRFAVANSIPPREHEIIMILFTWRSPLDLERAKVLIASLMEDAIKTLAGGHNVEGKA